MSIIIVSVLLLSYLFIATSHVTKINKSAIAIFAGTVCWLLYISYGADYVSLSHPSEYADYLSGLTPTSVTVKQYIAQEIFLKYVGLASEIAVFLLATMTIVEILSNNGCFDFISQLFQTRKSRRLLWIMSVITFFISANLDNLTTTVMLLTIMHSVVPNRKQRMVYGAAIVLSANFGGAVTVIGDPLGLVLWNMEAVTASGYFLTMLLPCLVAWGISVFLLGRLLPERIDHDRIQMPYRGDDTRLNNWQRLIMLFVGIGGLWFIPTFHNITKLSPFLGALCVLSVLWVVDELMNHNLKDSDVMIARRTPVSLQYGTIQMILYVMGIMLAIGVVKETGVADQIVRLFGQNVDNVWVVGAATALISTVLDNFTTAMNVLALGNVVALEDLSVSTIPFAQLTVQDGFFWKLVAYAAVLGGNVLCIGTLSGVALMKSERIRVGWYFRNVGIKVLAGGIVGAIVMWILQY